MKSAEVTVTDPAGQRLHMLRKQVAGNKIVNNIDLVYQAQTATRFRGYHRSGRERLDLQLC